MLDNLPPAEKAAGDIVSIGIVAATLAQWLPAVAALLTIVWTFMRIVESWPAFRDQLFGKPKDNDQ